MENNEIIEDLHVDSNTDDKILHRTLPTGVTQIKTILFYHDTYENLTKAQKGKQSISHPYHINNSSYWQQQYDTPFSFSLHTTIDEYLDSLAYDELIGYHTSFETFLYTITTVERLQHLEELQPKLAWKPLDAIRRTLSATTQWAITKSYFPMRKHHVSRFLWNNRSRLKETVSMDTIFPL